MRQTSSAQARVHDGRIAGTRDGKTGSSRRIAAAVADPPARMALFPPPSRRGCSRAAQTSLRSSARPCSICSGAAYADVPEKGSPSSSIASSLSSGRCQSQSGRRAGRSRSSPSPVRGRDGPRPRRAPPPGRPRSARVPERALDRERLARRATVRGPCRARTHGDPQHPVVLASPLEGDPGVVDGAERPRALVERVVTSPDATTRTTARVPRWSCNVERKPVRSPQRRSRRPTDANAGVSIRSEAVLTRALLCSQMDFHAVISWKVLRSLRDHISRRPHTRGGHESRACARPTWPLGVGPNPPARSPRALPALSRDGRWSYTTVTASPPWPRPPPANCLT